MTRQCVCRDAGRAYFIHRSKRYRASTLSSSLISAFLVLARWLMRRLMRLMLLSSPVVCKQICYTLAKRPLKHLGGKLKEASESVCEASYSVRGHIMRAYSVWGLQAGACSAQTVLGHSAWGPTMVGPPIWDLAERILAVGGNSVGGLQWLDHRFGFERHVTRCGRLQRGKQQNRGLQSRGLLRSVHRF